MWVFFFQETQKKSRNWLEAFAGSSYGPDHQVFGPGCQQEHHSKKLLSIMSCHYIIITGLEQTLFRHFSKTPKTKINEIFMKLLATVLNIFDFRRMSVLNKMLDITNMVTEEIINNAHWIMELLHVDNGYTYRYTQIVKFIEHLILYKYGVTK